MQRVEKGIHSFRRYPRESRGRGIERQLVEIALRELRDRGMTTAQASVDSRERDYVKLLEGFDFEQVRVGSIMDMALTSISQNIGESKQVATRSLRQEQEADMKLWTRL